MGWEDFCVLSNDWIDIVECLMYFFNQCSIARLTRRRRIVKMNLFVTRGSLPVGKSERL